MAAEIHGQVSYRMMIPEIMGSVFELLWEDAELYSSVFVCKFWSELALDKLWKRLQSIIPLLMVLAPMELSHEDNTWVCRALCLESVVKSDGSHMFRASATTCPMRTG